MIKQIIKFGMVGVANTIIGYFTYLILIAEGINVQLAMAGNWIIGSIFSFFLNKYWTFGQKNNDFKSVIRFIMVCTFAMLLNIALVTIAVNYIGMEKRIGGLVSMIFVIAVNFIGQKFFAFRGHNS